MRRLAAVWRDESAEAERTGEEEMATAVTSSESWAEQREIEEKLHHFFNLNTDYSDESYDLYTVALHFRLFRQHGHPISSDIFGRWMDVNGKFLEGLRYDGKGLLSLEGSQHDQLWNIEEMDKLPEYVKPFYKALLKLYEQFEEELAKEGRSYAAHYAIESLKELVRSYHVEAKSFIQGYLPPFEEYLKNALITCTYWLLICRVIDDIATYEVEKERGQSATGIESYMRDNDATIEETVAKFFEIATDAWKDINKECMRPSPYSRDVLMQILNLERIIDVPYKDNQDGYTQPEKVLNPHIVVLFVDPIDT
ncbi:hypothetical protein SASPL_125061 [Salvia splendens]|uniref:Viridiflorene synthase n=1 Tax=Salvia splendens TaxID=180675 RepID=A0A8X8XGG2_SALSN|nr:hypothetical protein SASPL_125061 [Salvia splendens]